MTKILKTWKEVEPFWDQIKLNLPTDVKFGEQVIISGIFHLVSKDNACHFMKNDNGAIVAVQGYVN